MYGGCDVELVLTNGPCHPEMAPRWPARIPPAVERTVDGGKTDLGILLPHSEKLVSREMVAGIQKGAQDGIALLRVFQATRFKVLKQMSCASRTGFTCGRRVVVRFVVVARP